MRAEHRHELKTNELAEWISEMPVWFKQHARAILYVSILVIFVAVYFFYYRYQTTVVARREQTNLTGLLSQLPQSKAAIARSQAAGNDRSFELLQLTQTLDTLATGTKQDQIAALALIKEAEILRTELHFRMEAVTPEELVNVITRAKDNYTKALDVYLKRSPNSSLEAAAKLGLGLCEEELGNFEQAKKIYDDAATNPAYQGTTSAAAAKKRLALMDSFNQKITLKPAPGPEPAQFKLNQPVEENQLPELVPQVEPAPEANTGLPNP